MKTKIFTATCENGEVKVGNVVVEATIESEGVGASQGLMIIEGDRAYYFAKTSPDLKLTLEKVIAALEKVSDALTSHDTAGYLIGAAMAVPSPPIATASIAAIDSAVDELTTLKGELR